MVIYLTIFAHLYIYRYFFHKWKYIHDEVGYNYRLPSINAALGIAQIKKIKGLKLNLRPSEVKPEIYYKITELYEKS